MQSTSLSTIVTGSSSGIGREIARTFLSAGHRVVLHGRSAAKLAKVQQELSESTAGAGDRLASVVGDIGDGATGQALARAALERFGRIDVLVNNAGVFGAKPFLDVTEEDLDGYLQSNLKGTYLTSQSAVREMRKTGGGSIVNIGTVLIDHAIGGIPATAPLVSKGGVHALTKTLSAELAPDDIRVNLVAPGMVRTPLHPEEGVDALGDVALLNRVGETHEIAEAVLFLATSKFTTGHILNVDGGFVTGRS